ncbi:MAG: FAD/NAD(P)-binding protein [Bacteroidota bacterium]
MAKKLIRIAILGGGPAGMFMYKRLIESGRQDLDIHIFERKSELGAGMPYSREGANDEHITNVSDNEIPELVMSVEEWVKIAPKELLERFSITPENFNEFKVLPRLFFGQYLSAQFDLLRQKGDKSGVKTTIHFDSKVADVIDQPDKNEVWVDVSGDEVMKFHRVVICTGHRWPLINEGKIKGYYDSPYPPSKLEQILNHPVAIKGSSLTAIDALRTLARQNGEFIKKENGDMSYKLSENSPKFKLAMHSLDGLLPAIRFHLDDTHLTNDSLLTPEEIEKHKEENDGFLSLDFVFEKNFKDIFREKDAAFFDKIKDMSLEEFVGSMMALRERLDAFQLFRAEYAEAEKSIRRKESVYWKEMLAVLSFAMNYPAKYLSAEDMQRLTKVLMPLISIVIAFVPQSSAREMLALYDAGVLELIAVNPESEVIPEKRGGITYKYEDEDGKSRSTYYKTFVNSIGQPRLSYEQFPFASMIANKTISPAHVRFKSAVEGKAAMAGGNKDVEADASGNYYLKVAGITINDNFQVADQYGAYNERIYIMAVPYIGGYNPDYSGLDFCEEASKHVAESIF